MMEAFEEAVIALHAGLLTAWNARDFTAFAGFFTESGLLIGFDGSAVPAAGVSAHLERSAAGLYVWRVREVRALADGVVLLSAITGTLPPGAEVAHPALNGVQSVVAVRVSSVGWRVGLLQNTPAQYYGRPDLAEAHTAGLAGGEPLWPGFGA